VRSLLRPSTGFQRGLVWPRGVTVILSCRTVVHRRHRRRRLQPWPPGTHSDSTASGGSRSRHVGGRREPRQANAPAACVGRTCRARPAPNAPSTTTETCASPPNSRSSSRTSQPCLRAPHHPDCVQRHLSDERTNERTGGQTHRRTGPLGSLALARWAGWSAVQVGRHVKF